jgi:hypothetical protein
LSSRYRPGFLVGSIFNEKTVYFEEVLESICAAFLTVGFFIRGWLEELTQVRTLRLQYFKTLKNENK